MADTVSTATRSRIMKAVGQTATTPELRVRKMLRQAGLRYRLNNRDLPGSPDMANRSKRWAIFVNGCFWHGHKNCSKTRSRQRSRIPDANPDYWGPKLDKNRMRDARKARELRQLGYRVLLVWECELRSPELVVARLERWLSTAD